MTLHFPGSPGEHAVNEAVDMMQAAIVAAQQKYGDDLAYATMFVKLAFGWLSYLKQEVISLDALDAAYGELRTARPQDIADLQTRLARFGA